MHRSIPCCPMGDASPGRGASHCMARCTEKHKGYASQEMCSSSERFTEGRYRRRGFERISFRSWESAGEPHQEAAGAAGIHSKSGSNRKIKLSVYMAYGFRNIDNMLDMIMLRCSDIDVRLPWEYEAA